MTGYRILYHHRIRADDGQAVHVSELIGALRRAGHEVLECALVPKAEPVANTEEADGAGSLWTKLSLPRRVVEVLEIAYSAQGTRMLMRAAADFRPHMIYERHALHCRAGLVAARRLGVPLLEEVNSPMCDEMARLGALCFPRRARRAERSVLAGADCVLAVTEVLRQRLLECGAEPERTRVISNGSQPERFGAEARRAGRRLRAGLPADAFVLGFVGYMRPWHRLDMALEAMAQPDLQCVHLMLVGEVPALQAVQSRAAALQLGARVHTMGVVPPDRLPAHVCAFDAALIPAINGYASPLKMFDSLAAGVITLAPDQPNLRERIEDGENGVLFAVGDVEALAERLRLVVTCPERARQIGESGLRSLIENEWTWDGNARRVTSCYEELSR